MRKCSRWWRPRRRRCRRWPRGGAGTRAASRAEAPRFARRRPLPPARRRSPSSSRRTRTCPSEPVPPVTRRAYRRARPCLDVCRSRRPRRPARHHLRPARGLPARWPRGSGSSRGCGRYDRVVRLDHDVELEGVTNLQQQVVLGDRLGAHVPEALSSRVALDDARDRAGAGLGVVGPLNTAAVNPLTVPPDLSQKPLEQAVAAWRARARSSRSRIVRAPGRSGSPRQLRAAVGSTGSGRSPSV